MSIEHKAVRMVAVIPEDLFLAGRYSAGNGIDEIVVWDYKSSRRSTHQLCRVCSRGVGAPCARCQETIDAAAK